MNRESKGRPEVESACRCPLQSPNAALDECRLPGPLQLSVELRISRQESETAPIALMSHCWQQHSAATLQGTIYRGRWRGTAAGQSARRAGPVRQYLLGSSSSQYTLSNFGPARRWS